VAHYDAVKVEGGVHSIRARARAIHGGMIPSCLIIVLQPAYLLHHWGSAVKHAYVKQVNPWPCSRFHRFFQQGGLHQIGEATSNHSTAVTSANKWARTSALRSLEKADDVETALRSDAGWPSAVVEHLPQMRIATAARHGPAYARPATGGHSNIAVASTVPRGEGRLHMAPHASISRRSLGAEHAIDINAEAWPPRLYIGGSR